MAIALHQDFLITQEKLYNRPDYICVSAAPEAESAEYGACAYQLNDFKVRFRVAKITPTKIGQFVTLWKRIEKGPTQPYDALDEVDFFVISVRAGNNFGQFVFPKSVLIEKNIFSKNGKGGKRGIRVYPSWDIALNAQAQKTQQWQLNYFLEIPAQKAIEYQRADKLYLVY